MKLAFYVSGNATRLRKILAGDRADVIACIRLVVSDTPANRDLEALLRARNIRFVCVDFRVLAATPMERSMVLSDLLLREFREQSIDHCFCFGSHILRGELLKAYAGRIINFHPSLLPNYPGLNSIDQAIKAGEKTLGNTAHLVTEHVDGGPILLQRSIGANSFAIAGYDGILDQQIPMLYEIFERLRNGAPSGGTKNED